MSQRDSAAVFLIKNEDLMICQNIQNALAAESIDKCFGFLLKTVEPAAFAGGEFADSDLFFADIEQPVFGSI